LLHGFALLRSFHACERTGSNPPSRGIVALTGNRRRAARSAAVLLSALAPALPTATAADTSAAAASWPSPTGQQAVSGTIKVSGTRDGGMVRYHGSGDPGPGGQDGDRGPLFEPADGATLKNVVLGAPAADGVHCRGTRTLRNVWWEDVGEDAATFKGTSASQTMTVDGGGARKASDKVFRHNGPGRMVTRNFQVEEFGKPYRACGDCGGQYQRHVVIENVTATIPGTSPAGINSDYGDTARLARVTIVGDSSRRIVPCERCKDVTSGEPTRIGSGPDGTHCLHSTSDITCR
jgi:hypothetical protein